MKKINLKSSELTMTRKKPKSSSTSLLFGIVLILIVLGLYGGVLYLQNSAQANIDGVKENIKNMKKKMDSEESTRLYDFQSRLHDVEALLPEKSMQGEMLNEISRHTLPEVRFKKVSSEFDKDNIKIVKAEVVTADHYLLAEQLEMYSQMENAKDVLLVDSKIEEEGIVSIISFQLTN